MVAKPMTEPAWSVESARADKGAWPKRRAIAVFDIAADLIGRRLIDDPIGDSLVELVQPGLFDRVIKGLAGDAQVLCDAIEQVIEAEGALQGTPGVILAGSGFRRRGRVAFLEKDWRRRGIVGGAEEASGGGWAAAIVAGKEQTCTDHRGNHDCSDRGENSPNPDLHSYRPHFLRTTHHGAAQVRLG